MAHALVNRAKMSVSGTPGTGAITLGAAVTGFDTFANAGVANGDTVSYFIEDGNNWEWGLGTYSSTGPTLTRTTVGRSSSGTTAISATSAAQVGLTALANDIGGIDLIATQNTTSGTTQTISSIPTKYKMLIVYLETVSCSTSSRNLIFSISHNGSTFAGALQISSGDSSTQHSGRIDLPGIDVSSATQSFLAQMINYNNGWVAAGINNASEGVVTGSGTQLAQTVSGGKITMGGAGAPVAIRFTWSGAGNFNGGVVRVYGVR